MSYLALSGNDALPGLVVKILLQNLRSELAAMLLWFGLPLLGFGG